MEAGKRARMSNASKTRLTLISLKKEKLFRFCGELQKRAKNLREIVEHAGKEKRVLTVAIVINKEEQRNIKQKQENVGLLCSFSGARSKKQGARSKKQETRSKRQEASYWDGIAKGKELRKT